MLLTVGSPEPRRSSWLNASWNDGPSASWRCGARARECRATGGRPAATTHQPAVLLRVAPPLPGRRHRGPKGPLEPAARLAGGDPGRGRREILWLRKHYHFGPAKIAM